MWARLGKAKQYIEPFFGSGAMLWGAPQTASLEVVGDVNGFLANFWRAVKCQPVAVADAADYPVSHIDQAARHGWLLAQRERITAEMADPFWPGDATVAGWWLWGQCSWIGSGWCEWDGEGSPPNQIPHVGSAGRGIQAIGQIPHVGDAGRGIQAVGRIPHVSDAGRGIQAVGRIPHVSDAGRGMITTAGRAALVWLGELSARLERVRIIHGDWDRTLNHCYGGVETAVFLDPPYKAFEALYSTGAPVAEAVENWARENGEIRIALCGHFGDYDLPGWEIMKWTRKRLTYSGSGTTDKEAIWFSPACLSAVQGRLFV